ncbi:MAG: hypothetical protein HKUEN07_26770 [Rhodocyclaceae bacterium]|nr:MAG: hypothetical protein HKUEN07_26770 [Rhodocyclaceae bacterium]
MPNDSSTPYAHLSDIPRLSGGGLKPRFFGIKKFLFDNPVAEAISVYRSHVLGLKQSIDKTTASFGMSEGGSAAQDFGSPYGYEDTIHELLTAKKYKDQIDRGLANVNSESGALYAHAEKTIADFLKAYEPPVFFNFGVSYAYVDSLLARLFPQIRFIGIDRSRYTQVLNEESFSHIPNMSFVAGDVFEHLSAVDYTGGVFFHTRTLTLLPKAFIRKLYDAVAAAGFDAIICMEQIGISRQTGLPYLFSDEDQPTVAFRDGMFVHNYPGLLAAAGYRVMRSELVRTAHPHADYRILSITSRRTSPAR